MPVCGCCSFWGLTVTHANRVLLDCLPLCYATTSKFYEVHCPSVMTKTASNFGTRVPHTPSATLTRNILPACTLMRVSHGYYFSGQSQVRYPSIMTKTTNNFGTRVPHTPSTTLARNILSVCTLLKISYGHYFSGQSQVRYPSIMT